MIDGLWIIVSNTGPLSAMLFTSRADGERMLRELDAAHNPLPLIPCYCAPEQLDRLSGRQAQTGGAT
ncbi:MAG: hypothetical protein GJU76_11840 [Gallionella sp.]|jgi:hypothetical protein|nr:hypothetical protein [Gallionella sp.]